MSIAPSTPRRNEPGSTHDRIMSAYEELIADRGIGNVSVRDITGAAGVNTAAVNYHFGTKERLLEAIVQRHAERFGTRRAELLHASSADGLTLRDVVRALVVATAELAADGENGGRLFLTCKQRMRADPFAFSLLERYFRPYSKEFLAALESVTPHLTDPVRILRFALARDAVDRAFSTGTYPGWIEMKSGGTTSHDEYTSQVIDFLAGGFAAPA